MDEKAFYRETSTTRSIQLNCPYCRTVDSYDLEWRVRLRKEQMPSGGDEVDRARFSKALSYMVLIDDKVACKNLRCRKRFDISGIRTTAFLSPDQEEEFRKLPSMQADRSRGDRRPGGGQRNRWQGQARGRDQARGQDQPRGQYPPGGQRQPGGQRYSGGGQGSGHYGQHSESGGHPPRRGGRGPRGRGPGRDSRY